MPVDPDNLIILGRVSSVYGVKGWVKIYSYTEPMDRILEYGEWLLKMDGQWRSITVDKGRSHGKGMVAHFEGCDDREQARQYNGADIAIPRDLIPELPAGDYYWFQLEGLQVVNTQGVILGNVDHMMSAGASNDVLVVKGNADSHDRQERLIPYVPDIYVKEVDLDERRILVDWDPEF